MDWDALESGVLMCLANGGGGLLEGNHEFACLEQGALYGVRFALRVANTLPCTVRITELRGEPECTNATVVAAASAYAVWAAVGFEPPPEVHGRVQAEVEASRGRPSGHLGLFEGSSH
jgi:hypothetical protein